MIKNMIKFKNIKIKYLFLVINLSIFFKRLPFYFLILMHLVLHLIDFSRRLKKCEI